jgi:hypothetical protein
MYEDISKEQYESFGKFHIKQNIISSEDIIYEIIKKDIFIVIKTDKRSIIFIKDSDDCFLKEFIYNYEYNTLYYYHNYDNIGINIIKESLAYINKTEKDMISVYNNSEYVELVEMNDTRIIFKHIDAMAEVITVVPVDYKITLLSKL